MKTSLTPKDLTYIGMLAAITAIMAQIAIPMPAGVPITLQTFAVCLAGMLLGSRRGFLAMLVYLLVGAAGLPVFSAFRGGVQMLAGPTGGFLLTFPIMALIVGIGADKGGKLPVLMGMVIGTVVNFAGGMLMFTLLTNAEPGYAFMATVFPFLPGAVIKCAAAALIGSKLRERLPALAK